MECERKLFAKRQIRASIYASERASIATAERSPTALITCPDKLIGFVFEKPVAIDVALGQSGT